MYTSMWYTKAESTPRYGFWYCGLGTGQIVGGLISFGAQHAPRGQSFGGWRIMFLVVGIANLLAGILALTVLPETPEKSLFLTSQEKERIAVRLRQDQAGTGPKVFRWRSIIEALFDLQAWLLMLVALLSAIPSGVVVTFSSILIKDFGYTPKQSALLNMPSGVVSILSSVLSTYSVARGFPRWIAINVTFIITILGAGLMSFLPKTNQGGLLAGIYLVNAVGAKRRKEGKQRRVTDLNKTDSCPINLDIRLVQ